LIEIIMQLLTSKIEPRGIRFLKHNASSRDSRIGCEAYTIPVLRTCTQVGVGDVTFMKPWQLDFRTPFRTRST
jgi:hypothetical protein